MIDKASPQVMTSQGMSLLGREPLRARDRVACCLGGWGSFCWQVFLQVQAAGKAGLDKTCGVQGVCALSVPNTCLISLLPGPGSGSRCGADWKRGKASWGWLSTRKDSRVRKFWCNLGKGRKAVSVRLVDWCSESCFPALAPQLLYY